MISRMKKMLPWQAKIGLKIVLARLPLGYDFWRELGLFRHGKMDDIDYAFSIFEKHARNAGLMGRLDGRVVMELGPGDSVITALAVYALGGRAVLLDAGPFAKVDLDYYKVVCDFLVRKGLMAPDLSEVHDLEGLLEACGANYLTRGLADLRKIPSQTVDFIFSEAVLEHVRVDEFAETMKECRRVLRNDGVCSHTVDLKDHLGGGLNNLRFSRERWEGDFFSQSGFYTNRIRFSAMTRIFREAGFSEDMMEVLKYDRLPIQRNELDPEFLDLAEDDLLVSGFTVGLRPNAQVA